MSETFISQDELNRLLQAERSKIKNIRKPKFKSSQILENFEKNSKLFSDRLKIEQISVTQEEVDNVLGKNR
ncbi:hypothetical protein [uncultured Treponema sp.]|uniref:hypothetical protein n=1 Tax=uncultured Treponema sp. TaxID=162155 RepID=UPI0025E449D5|nr:hypothetical protein [uncultured Treponema sp.]